MKTHAFCLTIHHSLRAADLPVHSKNLPNYYYKPQFIIRSVFFNVKHPIFSTNPPHCPVGTVQALLKIVCPVEGMKRDWRKDTGYYKIDSIFNSD
jgi:hypothetical protein